MSELIVSKLEEVNISGISYNTVLRVTLQRVIILIQ